jgi:hypothetical protein
MSFVVAEKYRKRGRSRRVADFGHLGYSRKSPGNRPTHLLKGLVESWPINMVVACSAKDLSKLDEAKRLLKSNDALVVQELVSEGEAFISGC